jgi:O-antigen/teichoic acid export membrane protein
LIVNRVVKAGSWVVLGGIIVQLVRLTSNLFLTRYLAPDAFGLMAVAFTLFGFISMLSDIGINVNIVQSKRGDDEIFLQTAWTLQCIRGLLVALFIIVASAGLWVIQALDWVPSVSTYAHPNLIWILLTISICAAIDGFLSVNYHKAERNLIQHQRVLLDLLAVLIPVPLMAAWVMMSPSVWALVGGALCGVTIKVLGSFWLFRGVTHRICFDKNSVQELLGFGKWVLLSSLLGFLALQGDKLLLAGFMTSREFGWFAIAGLIVGAMESMVGRVLSSVVFPVFAQAARTGSEEFTRVYYKMRGITDPLILLAAGGLFVLGDELINLMYPPEYQNVGWMVQILAGRLALLIYTTQGQVFLARGKPKWLSVFIAFQVVTIFVGVIVAERWFGLEQMVGVVALSALPGTLFCFYLFQREGWLNIQKEFLVIPYLGVGVLLGWLGEKVWLKTWVLLGT